MAAGKGGAYHSHFNSKLEGVPIVGKIPLLPLNTKFKGPAPPADGKDIIDEAIFFFRANVLFSRFEFEGDADVLLVYATLCIQEIMQTLKSFKTKKEAEKGFTTLMHAKFNLPSGNGPMKRRGLCPKPTNSADADKQRNYLKQMRSELFTRMFEVLFTEEGGKNKWWYGFQKKKFMGMDPMKK